jgi:hypothetical protein
MQDIGKSEAIVLSLLKPYLEKGHSVYVDTWYSIGILILFDLFYKNATNACGTHTVRKRRKGMPRIEERLKKGKTFFRSSNNLLAMKWIDKKEVYMLLTMHTAEFAEVTKLSKNLSV